MINKFGYSFEGPFPTKGSTEIKNASGVYIILDNMGRVIDYGESGDLKERIENHGRKGNWGEDSQVAVLYVDETSRMKIEDELRKKHLC